MGTLPKSFREQNIVTAVKENLDPEELARNQELTRSKTPAELAQIHSLSEFPVPENIKKFLTSEKKADNTKKRRKKEEKEQKKKEEAEIKKLQKQEEEKLKQRQEEERKKRVEEEKREKREKERQLEEERRA